ncbi:N-formylglutamate amidohydrolase [Roseimaritima ulvae]|uniref:N-formylglutamate amidohydrolase n=2 Tax=Roseimaritima ulvae TaxID=980254 RepID=A0A5B9QUF1_9BACT|nr:N-formylglutamate amidohydrolase [Roseimaritima ulvae]
MVVRFRSGQTSPPEAGCGLRMSLLITCENGGNKLPPFVIDAFRSAAAIRDLASPLGFDPGAKAAALDLAERTKAPMVSCPYSRLAIDVNRSPHHRHLFSPHTKKLSPEIREALVRHVYEPYRRQVHAAIDKLLQSHAYVIHIAVRSFPLQGKTGPRRTDVGLIYDPCREDEREFCLDWYEELYYEAPWIRVRRNYPVRGRHDSLVKSLRDTYSPHEYLGIEIHLNQAWAERRTRIRKQSFSRIGDTLATILELPPLATIGAA